MDGFLGGYQETKDWQQRQATNNLNMEKLGMEVQSAKDALALHDQQMSMFAERTAAAEQQYGGVPLDAKEKLQTWADVQMDTGNPVEAATIINHLGQVEKNSALTEKYRSDQAIRTLTTAAQGIQAVHDDASWNQYWDDYFTAHPKVYENPEVAMQLHELASRGYTPERKQQLLSQYTTQLQTAQIRRAQAETDLTRSRIETEAFKRDKYYPTIMAANEARAAHLKKAGSTEAPLKPEDVKAATDLIGSQYNILANPAAARTVGREVARRARQIEDAEGVSTIQARRQALEEAKAAGRFAGFRPGRAGAGSFEKPLVAPADKSFRAGTWYTGQPGTKLEGQKVFYDGSQFLSQEEMATQSATDIGPTNEELDEPDNYADEGEE